MAEIDPAVFAIARLTRVTIIKHRHKTCIIIIFESYFPLPMMASWNFPLESNNIYIFHPNGFITLFKLIFLRGRKLPFNRETSAAACLLLDTPEFAEETYMEYMIPEENLKWMRKCSYRESAILSLMKQYTFVWWWLIIFLVFLDHISNKSNQLCIYDTLNNACITAIVFCSNIR